MKASDVIIGGILPAAAIVINIGMLVWEWFFPLCLKRDKAVLLTAATVPKSPQTGVNGWLNLYKTELYFIPDDDLRKPILINLNEITRVWCSINANDQMDLQVQFKQGDVSGFRVRHAGTWAVAVIKRMKGVKQ
jgi:hypothetical protein